MNLVQMLLPEYENDIMSAPRRRRVYKFCFYFGKKYYPLPANMDCPPAEWGNNMPVTLFGLSYKEYHELDMRPGYLLMLSLVVYPWEGDDQTHRMTAYHSIRLPLAMVQRNGNRKLSESNG